MERDRPDRDRPPRPALAEPLAAADPDLLDFTVRRELRSLSTSAAESVARYLVGAAMLLDDDPAAALVQARSARSLASRIASVREATGLAAYHAGEYAEAIAELRAARRIDGSPRHLAVIADSERGLGRPERALELATDPGADSLDEASRVELSIVLSGARRDMGQAGAAVVLLQGPTLSSSTLRPWTARLWYAYAEALLAAGRRDDAVQWFGSVAAVDDGQTDADERLAELEPSDPDADLTPEVNGKVPRT